MGILFRENRTKIVIAAAVLCVIVLLPFSCQSMSRLMRHEGISAEDFMAFVTDLRAKEFLVMSEIGRELFIPGRKVHAPQKHLDTFHCLGGLSGKTYVLYAEESPAWSRRVLLCLDSQKRVLRFTVEEILTQP